MPWSQRAARGVTASLIETTKLFITQPRITFARLRQDDDVWGAVLYGALMFTVGLLGAAFWGLLLTGMPLLDTFITLVEPDLEAESVASLLGLGGLLIHVFIAPLLGAVAISLSALACHLGLLLVGGSQRAVGFAGTLQVLAYGSLAQLANAVPIVGGTLALAGTLVLAVIGIDEVHGVGLPRAAVAVTVPMSVCCACLGVLVFGGLLTGALAVAG
ncbi:MAG: hypothetical protein AAF772_04780 [Acidobacteriota bacterium]